MRLMPTQGIIIRATQVTGRSIGVPCGTKQHWYVVAVIASIGKQVVISRHYDEQRVSNPLCWQQLYNEKRSADAGCPPP
ncbi:hypothetical protein PCAR4_10003 [Paraburkholderia caribensis]|nr:hypothetical protein PCAR4_10003 [Paraburkholderia caribensis]